MILSENTLQEIKGILRKSLSEELDANIGFQPDIYYSDDKWLTEFRGKTPIEIENEILRKHIVYLCKNKVNYGR